MTPYGRNYQSDMLRREAGNKQVKTDANGKRERALELERKIEEYLAAGNEITVGKPPPEPVYTSYPARGW